jgi:hypothetical protein
MFGLAPGCLHPDCHVMHKPNGWIPLLRSVMHGAGGFWHARSGVRPVLIASGCVCAGIAFATMLGSGGLAAQRAGRPLPGGPNDQQGSLWIQATPLDDGRQMLLVVDQQNRALAIYHVDPSSGTLTLKSTRDVRWDLMVEEFNAQEPKPAALKKMLEMPK